VGKKKRTTISRHNVSCEHLYKNKDVNISNGNNDKPIVTFKLRVKGRKSEEISSFLNIFPFQ